MSAVVGIHVANILILTFLDVTRVLRFVSIKKRGIFTILPVVLNFDSEYLSRRFFLILNKFECPFYIIFILNRE